MRVQKRSRGMPKLATALESRGPRLDKPLTRMPYLGSTFRSREIHSATEKRSTDLTR